MQSFPRRIGASKGTGSVRQIQDADRWALYLPAACILLVGMWWQCLPVYPGDALGGFAFVAVVLLVRADLAPVWEKAIWLVLGAVLLTVELHVAYEAHLAAKSYLVCQFDNNGRLIVKEHGGTPIHSAYMHVQDLDKAMVLHAAQIEDWLQYQRLIQDVPLGEVTPATVKWVDIKPIQPRDGIAHYRIVFGAQKQSVQLAANFALHSGKQPASVRSRTMLRRHKLLDSLLPL